MIKLVYTSIFQCLLVTLFTHCFFDGGGVETPNGREQSQEHTLAAIDSLNLIINKVYQDGFSYNDYGQENWSELEAADKKFEEALELDATNHEAKFGKVITDLLLALQTHNLDSLLDDANTASPFDIALTTNTNTPVSFLAKKLVAEPELPEFHEFQDAITDSVLPVLDSVIVNLQELQDNGDFSIMFEIDGEQKELDEAELGIFLAGIKSLRAMITMLVSYDVDIDESGSYDFLDVLDSLDSLNSFSDLTQDQKDAFNHITSLYSPGSPFLTVKATYQSRLSAVLDEIKESLELVKASLLLLDVEEDDQNNDILALCSRSSSPDCIDASERDELINTLDSMYKYINEPLQITLDNIDTTITVDLSVLLGKIQDFKKLLPYYAFYPIEEWGEEKPVLYFTNQNQVLTANLNDVIEVITDTLISNKDMVDSLRTYIKFQDITFQGLLPGATEDGVWSLFEKILDQQRDEPIIDSVLVKKSRMMPLSATFVFQILSQ